MSSQRYLIRSNWWLVSLLRDVNRKRWKYRTFLRVRQQYGNESTPLSIIATVRTAAFPRITVLFYPQLPDKWQVAYKACVLNGFRLSDNPLGKYNIIHKHINSTTNDRYEIIDQAGVVVINGNANDIRKSRAQSVFEEVFGYQLAVDPRTYVGYAVLKSDLNYRHDGRIVQCPHEPCGIEEDVVYQRLVDTENSEGYFVDYRVPMFDGDMPLVYLKYRPASNRFQTFLHAEIVAPDDVFTKYEREQLSTFAGAMGLDFGEMDVLRDNGDGRIYVVDVNNTPAGPPVKLNAAEQKRAAAILASAYRTMVERRAFQIDHSPRHLACAYKYCL